MPDITPCLPRRMLLGSYLLVVSRGHKEQGLSSVAILLCCSVQCAVCSVRCAVCGVRCVVCGVWCAVCGVRCVVCGVNPPEGDFIQTTLTLLIHLGSDRVCVMTMF